MKGAWPVKGKAGDGPPPPVCRTPSCALVSPLHVGSGASDENYNSGFRVVRLAPIPEPSTYSAALGVMTLGVVMMRRRKACGTL